MGKKRHSKDKLYIVQSEYQRDWAGTKLQRKALPFRCLPFYCCGLSLLPFETPVCTSEGIIFDFAHISDYIKRYRRNPVTGAPLAVGDLIPLKFTKNDDNKYHCPVTYKEFNEHSHIVANRKSGYVYAYDAIDTLCRRAKSWVDLMTNEPFQPSDLITIQDPHQIETRKIEAFDYIKRGVDVPAPSVQGVEASEGSFHLHMKQSDLAKQILSEVKPEDALSRHTKVMSRSQAPPAQESDTPPKKHELFTTHRQASSFTSTALTVAPHAEFRDKTDYEMRCELYAKVRKFKKKPLLGYVRFATTLGVLNFELQCSKTPQTCDNFLRHCQSGYYRDTIFHRSIPHFMIQGGDPTGTGQGGESAFEGGHAFEDEFHPHLVHKGPGILSMANQGKNTNRSQFFITYASCEHLNQLHTVFGKLVGGFDTLHRMESLPCDKADRPKDPPRILECLVFKNPFQELVDEEEENQAKSAHKLKAASNILDPMRDHANRHSSEIGKYADFSVIKTSQK